MTESEKKPTRADKTRHLLCLQFPGVGKLLKKVDPAKHPALHRFRDTVAEAMDELYKTMPPEEADPILDYYFKDMPPRTEIQKRAAAKLGLDH